MPIYKIKNEIGYMVRMYIPLDSRGTQTRHYYLMPDTCAEIETPEGVVLFDGGNTKALESKGRISVEKLTEDEAVEKEPIEEVKIEDPPPKKKKPIRKPAPPPEPKKEVDANKKYTKDELESMSDAEIGDLAKALEIDTNNVLRPELINMVLDKQS